MTFRLSRNQVSYVVWLFYAYFCFYYFGEVSNGGDQWKTADWLINFYDGPIRRGLTGTILLGVSKFGFDLKWTVYATQIALYGIVFALVIKIYNLRFRDFEWLLILLSPAFILFPYYDLGGGFRKEIIVFVSYALLCLSYARGAMSYRSIGVAAAFFLVACFSHELTAFTLPFFAYVFYEAFREELVTKREAIGAVLLFSCIAFASLIFAVVFRGSVEQANAICAHLPEGEFSTDICDGAITALGADVSTYFGDLEMGLKDYAVFHSQIFLISIFPIVLTSWLMRVQMLLVLVGILFLIPLFVTGIDWGRWIHIFIFFLFCTVLADSVWRGVEFKKLPIVFVGLYLSVWGFNECCTTVMGGGAVDVAYSYLSSFVPQ